MLSSCGGRDEAASLYRACMKDFAAGRLPALDFLPKPLRIHYESDTCHL